MDKKAAATILFFMLFAQLAQSAFTGQLVNSSQANVCPPHPVPSYLDVVLDQPKGPGSIVGTYVYGLSGNYVKTGLTGATVFMVNLTNMSDPNVCYKYTDSRGWANFTYNSREIGCVDYWFIFCPQGTSLAGRQMCLNSTGLRQAKINGATECPGNTGSENASLARYVLSHNEFYLCNKQPSDYANLCWPLMLIFGLLVGASFLAGKNPFLAFDLSSPRMSRGKQYSMRAQQRSFDIVGMVMAADMATGSQGLSSLVGMFMPGGKDRGKSPTDSKAGDQKASPEDNKLKNAGLGCFLAGTKIATPDGSRPIEKIAVGETVLSFEGKKVRSAEVLETYRIVSEKYYEITAGNMKVEATEEHPFYAGGSEFRKAGELRTGDDVYLLAEGKMKQATISKISAVEIKTHAYNLRVSEPHTFFANGFAVHNKLVSLKLPDKKVDGGGKGGSGSGGAGGGGRAGGKGGEPTRSGRATMDPMRMAVPSAGGQKVPPKVNPPVKPRGRIPVDRNYGSTGKERGKGNTPPPIVNKGINPSSKSMAPDTLGPLNMILGFFGIGKIFGLGDQTIIGGALAPATPNYKFGDIIRQIVQDFFTFKFVDKDGKVDFGEILKSLVKMYMVLSEISKYAKAYSRNRKLQLPGISGKYSIDALSDLNLFRLGRNFTVGEIVNMIKDPGTMPWYLNNIGLGQLMQAGMDKLNLALTKDPGGVALIAYSNGKYTIFQDESTGQYRVWERGKSTEITDDAVKNAQIKSFTDDKKDWGAVGIWVDGNNQAHKFADMKGFDRFVDAQIEYNEAKARMLQYTINYANKKCEGDKEIIGNMEIANNNSLNDLGGLDLKLTAFQKMLDNAFNKDTDGNNDGAKFVYGIFGADGFKGMQDYIKANGGTFDAAIQAKLNDKINPLTQEQRSFLVGITGCFDSVSPDKQNKEIVSSIKNRSDIIENIREMRSVIKDGESLKYYQVSQLATLQMNTLNYQNEVLRDTQDRLETDHISSSSIGGVVGKFDASGSWTGDKPPTEDEKRIIHDVTGVDLGGTTLKNGKFYDTDNNIVDTKSVQSDLTQRHDASLKYETDVLPEINTNQGTYLYFARSYAQQDQITQMLLHNTENYPKYSSQQIGSVSDKYFESNGSLKTDENGNPLLFATGNEKDVKFVENILGFEGIYAKDGKIYAKEYSQGWQEIDAYGSLTSAQESAKKTDDLYTEGEFVNNVVRGYDHGTIEKLVADRRKLETDLNYWKEQRQQVEDMYPGASEGSGEWAKINSKVEKIENEIVKLQKDIEWKTIMLNNVKSSVAEGNSLFLDYASSTYGLLHQEDMAVYNGWKLGFGAEELGNITKTITPTPLNVGELLSKPADEIRENIMDETAKNRKNANNLNSLNGAVNIDYSAIYSKVEDDPVALANLEAWRSSVKNLYKQQGDVFDPSSENKTEQLEFNRDLNLHNGKYLGLNELNRHEKGVNAFSSYFEDYKELKTDQTEYEEKVKKIDDEITKLSQPNYKPEYVSPDVPDVVGVTEDETVKKEREDKITKLKNERTEQLELSYLDSVKFYSESLSGFIKDQEGEYGKETWKLGVLKDRINDLNSFIDYSKRKIESEDESFRNGTLSEENYNAGISFINSTLQSGVLSITQSESSLHVGTGKTIVEENTPWFLHTSKPVPENKFWDYQDAMTQAEIAFKYGLVGAYYYGTPLNETNEYLHGNYSLSKETKDYLQETEKVYKNYLLNQDADSKVIDNFNKGWEMYKKEVKEHGINSKEANGILHLLSIETLPEAP